MGVVWVHWLMARGQILKESLVPLATPYFHIRKRALSIITQSQTDSTLALMARASQGSGDAQDCP